MKTHHLLPPLLLSLSLLLSAPAETLAATAPQAVTETAAPQAPAETLGAPQESRRAERQARRAAQAAATSHTIDSILTLHRFLFVPNRVVTQMPGMPYATLNTYYEVAVTPDSLICNLPYYGYVYNTIYDPARSPYNFTALQPQIRIQNLPAGKEKGWVTIDAREQYNQRSYVLTFEIFSNGSASLTIQGVGTQHLQYLGNLLPITPLPQLR